jgi:hypothetical protein
LAIVFGALTLAAPASAQEASPPRRPWDPPPAGEPAPPPERPWDDPPSAQPRLERRWYGWQTLTTDAAAIALLVGTFAVTESDDTSIIGPLPTTTYTLGVLSYALGGPIIHFAHKNPGRGFGSFALRVLVPIAVIALSAGIACQGGGDFCGLIAVPFGGAAIISAIVVDAAVFAYDEVPVDSAGNQTFRLLPVVGLTRHGGSLGLALTL